MAAPTNTHLFPTDLAAFTVERGHVCIDEEKVCIDEEKDSQELSAPQIYGRIVRKIEDFIGSYSHLGDPSVRASLANLFDHFEGKITVIGPEIKMNAKAVIQIARSYHEAICCLRKQHSKKLQEMSISFMQCQVQEGLVFFFHDKEKLLEDLRKEGRIVIVGQESFVETDTKVDHAYRMALHYCRAFETTYPNEKGLEIFFNYVEAWKRAQIETGLIHLFCKPLSHERSSLSFSASSSASSSDDIEPLNN